MIISASIYFLLLFFINATFLYQLAQYNDYLVSTVDTDGLVLYGVCTHVFPAVYGSKDTSN